MMQAAEIRNSQDLLTIFRGIHLPRHTSRGVLVRHAPNELANLRIDLRPTGLPCGSPTPVKTEARAMASDDRIGLNNKQRDASTEPEPRQPDPEDTVSFANLRAFD